MRPPRGAASWFSPFSPFSAHTRMSGVNIGSREVRKGAAEAVRLYIEAQGFTFPARVAQSIDEIARKGSANFAG